MSRNFSSFVHVATRYVRARGNASQMKGGVCCWVAWLVGGWWGDRWMEPKKGQPELLEGVVKDTGGEVGGQEPK